MTGLPIHTNRLSRHGGGVKHLTNRANYSKPDSLREVNKFNDTMSMRSTVEGGQQLKAIYVGEAVTIPTFE